MEIEGEDGTKFLLKRGSKTSLGRGLPLPSDDRSVSRRHVSLTLLEDEGQANPNSETRVCFEATGKNPIWVLDGRSGEIKVFRRFERGEIIPGDGFCVSAKKPVWFRLKRKELRDEEESGSVVTGDLDNVSEGEIIFRGDGDSGIESLDVSEIDPVQEFGFLVEGHEFDHYPKQMIRNVNNWDWFLEEPRKENEDDEVIEKKRKGVARRKRKLDEVNDDDEDWTGDSDDDSEVATKLRQISRTKYPSTRSKDHRKTLKETRSSKASAGKKTSRATEEDSDAEDDDSLGGFIVDDEDEDLGDETDEDEEEEEEEFEDNEEEDV